MCINKSEESSHQWDLANSAGFGQIRILPFEAAKRIKAYRGIEARGYLVSV